VEQYGPLDDAIRTKASRLVDRLYGEDDDLNMQVNTHVMIGIITL
jgi:hypothetical protein